jgi:phage terminase small subunit
MAKKTKKQAKPTSLPKPLSQKQIAFCREYNVDYNGTQAAIRAGYSERTAGQQAERALKKVEIKAEIERLQAEKAKRCEINADYVLNAIRSTLERCQQAEPVIDHMGNPTGVYKFDANAVLKASELLGKHIGLFKDPGSSKQNPLHIAGSVDLGAMSDEELARVVSGSAD